MAQYTPMIMQYLEVKKNYQDSILFYRLGDFYEMFFDDAIITSKELDLILTKKAAGNNQKIPMCGIPYHAVDNYLPKLVNRGYKVCIVEQVEDPKTTKSIVKRDVVKVVTPGTLASVDEKESTTIASIIDNDYCFTIVIVDVSSGDTIANVVDHNFAAIKAILLKNNIKEVVIENDFSERYLKYFRELSIVISYCHVADIGTQYQALYQNISDEKIIYAFKVLVTYLMETQFQIIEHLRTIQIEDDSQILKMDFSTIMNLELTHPIHSLSKNDTLWSFLDLCKTSMGSRLLKKLIEKPLVNKEKINQRLDQITIIKDDLLIIDELDSYLSEVYDIYRLVSKIAMNSANPLDLVRLKRSLEQVPKIKKLFADYSDFKELLDIDEVFEVVDLINRGIKEEPKVNFKEIGVIERGFNQELDDLINLSNNNQSWILQQEAKEKEKTGINNLKIAYNKVHGFYIEVSKGQVSKVLPEYGYIRKQTLTTAERYITEELKSKEDEILTSKDKAIAKEIELYNQIVQKIKKYLFKIQRIADVLSYMDCLASLAKISSQANYVRPNFENEKIEIHNGRHPILDRNLREKFVSNNVLMEKDEIMIITGPNMGGKSTYMRTCALISILGQIGCYVPASKANLCLFDGMALASSMIEYIHYNIHAKTMFSTHYHELTSLEDSLENTKNYHAEIHEENDEVKFLYTVKKGKADKSYGINVAKLAKLPDEVIARAKVLLNEYESEKKVIQQSFPFENVVKVKEAKSESLIEEKLKDVDINNLSPRNALNFLYDLYDLLDKE